MRLPIVGVIGSGSVAHEQRAAEIGSWLATQGVHLLTGAGSGVMSSVSQAFFETPHRQGLVIGIVPCQDEGSRTVPKRDYPNPWVEIPIRTHLHLSGTDGESDLSRNHIVVLSSQVLIALPGGQGTASEVRLAIRYERPVVAYLNESSDIQGDLAVARVEANLDRVKAFVLKALGK